MTLIAIEQVQQDGSQTDVQVVHKCKPYVRYDSDYTFSAIRGVHVYVIVLWLWSFTIMMSWGER